MVINSWSYKELQRFCKAHGLLAIGKTDELRDRVKRYFCTGSVVDVIFDDDPSQPRKICRGVITKMLLNEGQYGQFEVQYEDNGEIFNHGIRAGAEMRPFTFIIRPRTEEERRLEERRLEERRLEEHLQRQRRLEEEGRRLKERRLEERRLEERRLEERRLEELLQRQRRLEEEGRRLEERRLEEMRLLEAMGHIDNIVLC